MGRAAKIVVVLFVIAAGGFFIYSIIGGWHKTKLDTALKQQQDISRRKTAKLEQQVSELEKELAIVKGQIVPEEKLAEVFGGDEESSGRAAESEKLAVVIGEVKKLATIVQDERELSAVLRDENKIVDTLGKDTTLVEALRKDDKLAKVLRDEKKLTAILRDESMLAQILAAEAGDDAAADDDDDDKISRDIIVKKKIPVANMQPNLIDIERRILAFFSYLDDQPYVRSYQFAGGAYLQYQIAIKNLSTRLPIIAGEMQSLYDMVRNVAHFYRVMGKKRAFATSQVLQNESEIIESVMQTFYQWFTMDSGGRAPLAGRLSPEIMYEYAGYILNTLGGRSYLLRRSPKVRALTVYYCVLALDKANDDELNSKGIDIRPYIKSSLMDVKNQIGLIYQKNYIAKLTELSLKYY